MTILSVESAHAAVFGDANLLFPLVRGMDDFRKGKQRAPDPPEGIDLKSAAYLRWAGYGLAMYQDIMKRQRVMRLLGVDETEPDPPEAA